MQEQSRANQRNQISDPKDIAIKIMGETNAINRSKDNLTTTIRTLITSSEQLVVAFTDQQQQTIMLAKEVETLNKKIADLEAAYITLEKENLKLTAVNEISETIVESINTEQEKDPAEEVVNG